MWKWEIYTVLKALQAFTVNLAGFQRPTLMLQKYVLDVLLTVLPAELLLHFISCFWLCGVLHFYYMFSVLVINTDDSLFLSIRGILCLALRIYFNATP